MIKLEYEKEDKTLSDEGWVINHHQLEEFSNQLASLGIICDKEIIESVLLIANGKFELLKDTIKELENF